MSPVRIKYYGLIPMTRFAYLVALAAAGAFALAMVLLGAILGGLPPLDTMWSRQHHLAGPGAYSWLHNHLYWVFLVCLVAQMIDTFCTLRLFAKKEKEQHAYLDRLVQEVPAGGANPSSASQAIQGRVDHIR